MVNTPPANAPMECPNCKSPIAPGKKFCESCGAKVEQPLVCGQCGIPLLPNAKFCESCGKVVTAQEAPPVSAVPSATAPPAVKPPVAVPAPAELKKQVPFPKVPAKAPASSTQTMVIAGVVGLVIVAALAYFVLLPMLSAPGTPSGGTSIGTSSGTSVPLSGALPSTTSAVSSTPAQTAASVSFVTEPTQLPPTELLVTYQADRDPITGVVTVTFTGGAGKNGVSDVFIRLTRSDGEVQTQTFTPKEIGSFATLQGMRMTDRIEVTANYFNGAKYRIIDQLFEYKKRNI